MSNGNEGIMEAGPTVQQCNSSWQPTKLTSVLTSGERILVKLMFTLVNDGKFPMDRLKGCDAECSCSLRLFPRADSRSQDKLTACRFIHINCDWKKIRHFPKKYVPHSDLIIMPLIVSASEERVAFGSFFSSHNMNYAYHISSREGHLKPICPFCIESFT